MHFSQIEEIIADTLKSAEEDVRREKLASAPSQGSVEGEGLDQQVEKLAAVFDLLARDPDAFSKVSAPHNGSDSPEVQPPDDKDRSTTETMGAQTVPAHPQTKQEGTVSEPATDADRSTTEVQNPAPVLKQSSALQAHVFATARIFEAANRDQMPDLNKIAADSGLSISVVSGILQNIMGTKTAADTPAAKEEEEGPPPKEEGSEGKQKAQEPTDTPTESKEAAQLANAKARPNVGGSKSPPPPGTDVGNPVRPKVAGAENTSASSPTEFAASEGAGGSCPEARAFLASPEAAIAFKKRQAQVVSNRGVIDGLFNESLQQDQVVHRHFANAAEAGVKTTAGGQ